MKDSSWSIELAKAVYGIGDSFREYHFLDIDEKGQLCLKVENSKIPFNTVLDQLLNLSVDWEYDQVPSLTLRVPQLIKFQINKLKTAFQEVLEKKQYQGSFFAIYPIKVNQFAYTIRAILEYGGETYGLEAGTKSELVIILEVLQAKKWKKNPICCNGVKDVDYLKLINSILQEGYDITISVESLREAEAVFEFIDHSRIKLALRIKPYFTYKEGEGHWAKSSGRNSKFGLSIDDLFNVVNFLKKNQHQQALRTLHAHIGSQITSMDVFDDFAIYMTKVYKKLRDEGFNNLLNLNFGGGLAIDYKGMIRSSTYDYFEKYAENLVSGILSEIEGYPHPNILVESGRAVTAHHTMVLTQILEVREIFPQDTPDDAIQTLIQGWSKRITSISSFEDFLTVWEDFRADSEQIAIEEFDLTAIKRKEHLVRSIRYIFRQHLSRNLKDFKKQLVKSKIYRIFSTAEKLAICNFSVFNAACDAVLVKQYFPVFPIENLHLQPETLMRIVDITCDSDGELSTFITKDGMGYPNLFTKDFFPLLLGKANLELQGLPVSGLDDLNESYFLIGLLGAYQDVIEFDHNLIGDLPDAEIFILEDGKWQIRWLNDPESLVDVVKKVGYEINSEIINLKQSSYVYDSWNRNKTKNAK